MKKETAAEWIASAAGSNQIQERRKEGRVLFRLIVSVALPARTGCRNDWIGNILASPI
jgi:hypothetical protein